MISLVFMIKKVVENHLIKMKFNKKRDNLMKKIYQKVIILIKTIR